MHTLASQYHQQMYAHKQQAQAHISQAQAHEQQALAHRQHAELHAKQAQLIEQAYMNQNRQHDSTSFSQPASAHSVMGAGEMPVYVAGTGDGGTVHVNQSKYHTYQSGTSSDYLSGGGSDKVAANNQVSEAALAFQGKITSPKSTTLSRKK